MLDPLGYGIRPAIDVLPSVKASGQFPFISLMVGSRLMGNLSFRLMSWVRKTPQRQQRRGACFARLDTMTPFV